MSSGTSTTRRRKVSNDQVPDRSTALRISGRLMVRRTPSMRLRLLASLRMVSKVAASNTAAPEITTRIISPVPEMAL